MASLPTGKTYLRKLNKLSKLLVNIKNTHKEKKHTENHTAARNFSSAFNILMNRLSL